MRKSNQLGLIAVLALGVACARNPGPSDSIALSQQEALRGTGKIYLEISGVVPASAQRARDFLRADIEQQHRFVVVDTPEAADATLRVEFTTTEAVGTQSPARVVGRATMTERGSQRTIYVKRLEPRSKEIDQSAVSVGGLVIQAVQQLTQDLHRAAGI